MKRIGMLIAVLLAMSMLLAACGPTPATTTASTTTGSGVTTTVATTTGYERPAETLTYSLMGYSTASRGDYTKMWLFEQIELVFNIRFDITQVSSEAWVEKKNIAFATNTLPDLFGEGLTNIELATYGGQGTILKLDEYIDEYAPDVMALFAELPEARAAMTFPDGHIYDLRGINTYPRELSKYRFWLNKQWAENLDVPFPTTLDEFYNYLKAIKDGDPNGNGDTNDEIPLGGMYTNWNVSIPILTALGFTETRIEAVDGKVIFVPAQPLYKEYLAYMNKLFSEGLLDQEYFTQNNDQRLAKLSQGLIGAFGDNANWTVMPEKDMWIQYVGIVPMTSEFNSEKIWPAHDVRLIRGFAITNQAKDPENLVRVGNWFYTNEGSIASNAGVENGKWPGGAGGYEWTTNEEGLECFKLVVPEAFTSYNNFREQVITPHIFPYLDVPSMPQVQWITGLDERQRYLTQELVRCEPHYQVRWSSNIKLTEEEANEANLILTDIDSHIAQMEAKMIVGEIGLDQFDAYVQGLYDRGLERYLEINQAAYDRWAGLMN